MLTYSPRAAAPANSTTSSTREKPSDARIGAETVTVTVHGTEFFDENGTWVRTLLHASYDSVLTGPTGTSIPLDAHQNAEFTAEGINTLTGQSANVSAPGLGLLYQDVGRLVFDITVPFPGETLFVSAKAAGRAS
jgi:hypothetical protein